MFRLCEEKIQNWIDNSQKALLIYGARQVGKTYLVRKMLKQSNLSFCEYNLIERTDILNLLIGTDNASDISEKLAMYSDVALKENESVIFLDEIQTYPDIITKIKFLVDEGRYRYVLSGSNLGVELTGIRSIPVGYMESIQMFPMNYEEFAIASGITEKMLSHIKDCFGGRKPVDSIVHSKLIQAFYYYLIVGGMPAVVRIYNDTHSLERIDQEQKNIINQYKADFTKYEQENRRLKIISIYDNIPSQLNKQNRKFSFTMLNKELKFDRYEESFLWLKDAAVAIPTLIVSTPQSPLEISKETNVFKLFLSDVGLLTSCYPFSLRAQIAEMDPAHELNNGSLFENFVAQEIYAGCGRSFYYKKKTVGEVDFMIESDGAAIPVEVKSGNDYKHHAALDHLLENFKFDEAYVLSPNNVETDGIITYLPIYMAGLIAAGQKYDDIILPAVSDISSTDSISGILKEKSPSDIDRQSLRDERITKL